MPRTPRQGLTTLAALAGVHLPAFLTLAPTQAPIPNPNVSLKNCVRSVRHKDQLGAVTAVTGPDGLKDERTIHGPFGEPVDVDHDPTASTETKRFLGEGYDAGGASCTGGHKIKICLAPLRPLSGGTGL